MPLRAFGAASSDCAETYFLSLKLPSKCESQHNMPLGAGVSAPSVNTNPLENPAGFIFNSMPKVHASYSRLDSVDKGAARTSVLAVTGNGGLGGGMAFHSFSDSARGSTNIHHKEFSFGAASAIDSANAAAGLMFSKSIDDRSQVFAPLQGQSANPVNLGTILNPKGKVKYGGMLFDVMGGVVAGGIGASGNLGEQTTAALDILGSTKKNSYVFKGTIGTSISIVQLTAGYGAQVGSQRVLTWIPTGVSLGAGAWLFKEHLRLVAYYNQVDVFYLGATFSFQ